MKKALLLCLTAIVFCAFIGCGKAEEQYRFETENNTSCIYYLVTYEELLEMINDAAKKDNYPTLSLLDKTLWVDGPRYKYTINGVDEFLLIDTYILNNCVTGVTLITRSHNELESRYVGKYAEILFEIFSPGNKGKIGQALYFYDANPPDIELSYTYGNTEYCYKYTDKKLELSPLIIEKKDKVEHPPIKP